MMGLDTFWGVKWIENLHGLLANSIMALATLNIAAARADQHVRWPSFPRDNARVLPRLLRAIGIYSIWTKHFSFHSRCCLGLVRTVVVLSLLQIFNAFTPKDGGSLKVGQGIAFGNEPRQQLDIYASRDAKKPLPVVFFIYGGSWNDGDRRNYDFVGRAIAALGYVTVIADYRLLPKVEYPSFLDDGLAAMKWLTANISEYGGDPARTALMGHSAGAYNAVMLALHPSYRSAPGPSEHIRCVVGLSGPYDFYPFDGKISRRTFGGVIDPQDTQPVQHVTSAAPSMLLGTGEKDRLVYPRNTVALANLLRQAGVEVNEIHYAKLGHAQTLLALSRPGRHLAPVLSDVAAFLALHLA